MDAIQQVMKFAYLGDDKLIDDLLRDPKWKASLDDYRPPIMIPKRSGGFRKILEPKPYLKESMRAICRKLGDLKFGASMYAHGFVIKRGRRSNAEPHIGHAHFLKMDLKDFFGTCNPGMVTRALSYHDCPEWLISAVRRICFLDHGLPQGAPTSPMLANIAAREMDFRLAGLCRTFQRIYPRSGPAWAGQTKYNHPRVDEITYTRYADDLAFSSDWEGLLSLRHPVTAVVNDCGFEVNEKKSRVFSKPKRIEICGVVVSDEKVNTRRSERRFWRGRLHRMVADIETGKVPTGHYADKDGHVCPISRRMLRSIQGHVAAVVDISPQDKERLLGGVRALRSCL